MAAASPRRSCLRSSIPSSPPSRSVTALVWVGASRTESCRTTGAAWRSRVPPDAGPASASSCPSRAGETAWFPCLRPIQPSCQRHLAGGRTEVRSEYLATLAKRSRLVKPGVGAGCMSAFVSFRCNFRPFGAASEGTSRAGSEVFRQSFVVAQGRGPHLKDRLGPLGIIPVHLRSLHAVVHLLHQRF